MNFSFHSINHWFILQSTKAQKTNKSFVLQPSPSSSSLSSIRSNSSQIINSAPSSARGEEQGRKSHLIVTTVYYPY